MARHALTSLDARRFVPAGLALGATLLGAGLPAAHALAADAPAAHPARPARVAALPPAVPARSDGAAEAITDIWGRGSGAPPRGV